MIRVAHFVENFPQASHGYIYNQLFNNDHVESFLVTEYLKQERWSVEIKPFYYERHSRIYLLNILRSKLNCRVFNAHHIDKFNRYARKVLEENRADIMHAHFGSSGYKLAGLKGKLNIPLVVTFYGWDVSYCLKSPLWLVRFKPMFEAADRLIVLCDEVKERLEKLGCSRDKIKVWNIGIDLDTFPYQRRTLFSDGKTRLLIAARFVEKKGYPVLIKALSFLAKKGKRLHLTAIGYGPLKKAIEELIHNAGLKDMVTLIDTSTIDDFNRFYSRVLTQQDIFVLPSTIARDGDDEGGPALSLVCAQAAGLPVVATAFAGASRSIIDRQTGLFVKDGDPEDLAEKLGCLMDNPELCNKLGEAASKYVRDNFSLAGQLEKLQGIYFSLLGKR